MTIEIGARPWLGDGARTRRGDGPRDGAEAHAQRLLDRGRRRREHHPATDAIRGSGGGGGRFAAGGEGAGGAEDRAAEPDDAEIGGAEVLAGAVGDQALAVLDRGVLLRQTLDAGE